MKPHLRIICHNNTIYKDVKCFDSLEKRSVIWYTTRGAASTTDGTLNLIIYNFKTNKPFARVAPKRSGFVFPVI